MPNIKPVFDLRNYNAVLSDISEGEPVFLTKNGKDRYTILKLTIKKSHVPHKNY